jgi:FERM, RhoGEF and pleckstrin domain protein 2
LWFLSKQTKLTLCSRLLPDYHGINGNVSLDRRSEIVQSANRYDLTLGSDKSSTSRNGTTYDVVEAERNNQQNIINNNTMASTPTSFGSTQTNGNHGTLERSDTYKKKWPTDKAYFLSKEILMTERTYKRDLDVINTVSGWIIETFLTVNDGYALFSAFP